MKIVVIGGGPSGLYFALLAKNHFPAADIRVFEQNPEGATYGFGIVLADRGLNRFADAHRPSYDAIMAASFVSRNRIISHPDEAFFVPGGGYGGAISRLRQLEILESFCRDAGIPIRHEARIDGVDSGADLAAGADLVVAADGVNSAVRRSREHEFGTTTYHLTNRLAWYGTTRHFPYPLLSFIRHPTGHFVGAAYAYTERMSTFVAECDAETWTRSGLDRMSENEARQFTESVFSRELQGHPLIGNNSAWRQLPVTRNRAWSADHVVLIGDALHSAHPTIGSGTRIAMEDSIALADALFQCNGRVPETLAAFRQRREPQKAKLVDASERSSAWYEDFAKKMQELPPAEFVFDFLMRTGRLSRRRLMAEYPEFMNQYAHRVAWPSPDDSVPARTLVGEP